MKLSSQELMEDLKRVSNLLGKIPTQKDYSTNGKFSTTTFTNRKPWNKWLLEIFGKTNRKISWKNGNKISKKDLIDNLLNLYKKIRRVPQKEDLEYSKYGISGYNRIFGSFSNALITIGLKPHQRRGLTNKELISDLQRVYHILGHTPSLEDFTKHSKTVSWVIVYNRFGSWTKALLAANIPIEKAQKIFKQDVLQALKKWYKQNNYRTSCLEYWTIRKAKARREFPYSCETISNKFNKIPWENIMKQIDSKYKTVNQFVKRGCFLGEDGNKYLSSIEKETGDILFNLKKTKKIIDYNYEYQICSEKQWSCDFKIILRNNKYLWLEVDGMRNNRKNPYKSGFNKKIEFYKEKNFHYLIISYNNENIEKTILNEIFGGYSGKKKEIYGRRIN